MTPISTHSPKKVLVGMSGGVDSSVTAALLQQRGYQVTGVTMSIWDGTTFLPDSPKNACYGPNEKDDIISAQKVAQQLNIPFHVLDLSNQFTEKVLRYFEQEYFCGRTPNPCVICNRTIKFEAMLQKARAEGIEFNFFATGHYARIEYDVDRKRYLLKRGQDRRKDQSYFLYALTQDQLGNTLFPLGNFTKFQVKERAREFKLTVADKEESQDFVSCSDYTHLFSKKAEPGPIMDCEGTILGQHKGIVSYTIGQRRGLGIAAPKPLYVIHLDPEQNAVIVGPRDKIYAKTLEVTRVNWIPFETFTGPLSVYTKIRQQHIEQPSFVEPLPKGRVLVRFEKPQAAITPGQMAVFYDDDLVIGGGIIDRVCS